MKNIPIDMFMQKFPGLQSKELPQELKKYHPDGKWMPPPLDSDEVKDMQGPMVTLLKVLAKHSQQHVVSNTVIAHPPCKPDASVFSSCANTITLVIGYLGYRVKKQPIKTWQSQEWYWRND